MHRFITRPASAPRPAPVQDRDDRGQVIVLFALALVALCAMVGLVIDGGGTFAQRRDQQSAADMAALAGANDYLLNRDTNAATTRARAVASANGFADGGAIAVNVAVATANGAEVTVTINAPHRNSFAGILGMGTWPVSVTATALTGFPDAAVGAAPMLFSVDAFGANGQPLPAYGNSGAPFTFDHGTGQSGDAPDAAGLMSWTDYDPLTNDNTSVMRAIILGTQVVDTTIGFGDYIGEHNNGQHAALFGDLQFPADYPVPIVDHTGHFMGWATFHLTGASQGGKSVTGYFKSNFISERLSIRSCSAAANDCPRYVGSFVLKLVN